MKRGEVVLISPLYEVTMNKDKFDIKALLSDNVLYLRVTGVPKNEALKKVKHAVKVTRHKWNKGKQQIFDTCWTKKLTPRDKKEITRIKNEIKKVDGLTPETWEKLLLQVEDFIDFYNNDFVATDPLDKFEVKRMKNEWKERVDKLMENDYFSSTFEIEDINDLEYARQVLRDLEL